MNKVDSSEIVVDEFGNVDTEYYVLRAKQMRSEAIFGWFLRAAGHFSHAFHTVFHAPAPVKHH
ncbi:MAG: hypothetical protein HUJ30_05670 [Gammaproteobacteria bacterium]|nr:hypothetical protein [Gammaproteobacteria bacterium]